MPQVDGIDIIWNNNGFPHSESRQIPQQMRVYFLGDRDVILIGGDSV